MRAKIAIAVAVLIALVATTAVVCLFPRRPHAGPWRLPDGSELSLAGVTYGKNHVMRYGDRIVDYLYPILTPALRKRFGCKVLSVPVTGTNSVVVWLWDKGVALPKAAGVAPAFAPTLFNLTTEDKGGMNSWFPEYPIATTIWHKTNFLYGFALSRFPRRSGLIRVTVRGAGPYALASYPTNPIAEFTIPNGAHTNYPVWTASALPVPARTNGIEVSLVDFEMLPRKKGMPAIFRLGFSMPENQPTPNHLALRHISAEAATGEFYESAVAAIPPVSPGRTAYANLVGALWQEEPGWKVRAEFWRTADFPAAELWSVKGIALPGAKQTRQLHLATNLYGSEIEVVAITGGLSLTNDWTGKISRVPAVLHVSSPVPALETHLRLVEVKDDQGRAIKFELDGETLSTAGRGATIRQSDKDYTLEVTDEVKSVDVTLAYTKSFSLEFLAKPTVGK